MRIRRISNAAFQRNIPFWIGRQAKGEEIHLMQMGEVVGILYADPVPVEPEPGLSTLRRGNRPIWKTSWERRA